MIPPIASRFVAGETAAEALDHARSLNERDVGAILNLLGEHYEVPERADADTESYLDLLGDLAGTGLRACVSVKPSQLGFDVAEERFRGNLGGIVATADTSETFVWIDMEDHTTTGATLDAFEAFAREYPGTLGVCLQANLRRTRDDLERLRDVPGKVRLVKGAYDPPPEVAYQRKSRVNEAYEDLITYAFREFDGGIAVASHDPDVIDLAKALHDEHGTDFEFQMLMGVREEAQYDLASEYPVWQYVPYGGKWLSYFYRRVAERRENLAFALRALVSG